MGAWAGFLRTHSALIQRLDAELRAEHGLALTSYDVLTQLAAAPDRRLRMSELAEAVLLTRSGLTRLVDRLERQGLVERRACPSDARSTFAALTDSGLERLLSARATHLEGVRRLFLDRLSTPEAEGLAALWPRLVQGAPQP